MAKGNNVRVNGDFSQLAEFIGSFQGWEERVRTPHHIGSLLEAAHGLATKQFDTDAAVAAPGGGFSHMYEWGTTGVNHDGPGLAPTTRAARLWNHRLVGRGTSRKIDFTFRPSVVEVPLDENITVKGKMSRHVFHGKAWVTEMGVPVQIVPDEGKALLIPFRGNPGQYADQRSIDRGYMMYPYTVRIGPQRGAGNFSAYWIAWWNGEGRRIVSENMDHYVSRESDAVIKVGKGRGTTIKKYANGKAINKTFRLQVSNAKAKAYAQTKINESKLEQYQVDTFDANMDAIGGTRG